MPKTVMALVPHPDDAEYHAGGLLANFAAEGVRIIIVIATDGRCGSYDMSGEELAKKRAAEAENAARVLGADPPIMLGYHDFETDLIPPGELREKFICMIRENKPDVTISEDPDGIFELHPDHRTVARCAAEAIQFAQLPLVLPQHLAQGLQPHFVTEKYFWAEKHIQANKVIDISDTFERKMAALAEHSSQVKFLVEGVFQQAVRAGLDLNAFLGSAAADPLAALTWAMQVQAAEIGEPAGFKFGELYRYERYHPFVEAMLAPGEVSTH